MKWNLAALALLTSVSANASANECGSVTIADMNWNSASLLANIDKFILEHAYGCDAELVPGDTMPTATSMVEKGQPDIAPELWTNAVKEAIDLGLKEGRIITAGESLIDGGEEGFWVPAYLVEKYPELATIEGVKKHPELFKHPEDPSAAAFYGCPAGWGCQISGDNLFEALGLEDAGFEIVDSGSGAGLSGSIAKAYERGEGWFGYYWAPTAILGKYEMVKVDFGTGVDEKHFLECVTNDSCEAPRATMYPKSPVNTIVASDFATSHPVVMDYIGKRGITNADLNKILAWMENEQADAEDTMFYFFENYPQVWQAWLSEDAGKKVAAKL